MSRIIVERVSVSFPIYDGANRSFRNRLVAAGTGGHIRAGTERRVVVNAIDNLSFVVEQGDRLALIGHNGAGKTTLLRVLAGIYSPEVGRVLVDGSVAPLFDTGFRMDPDATGYENIRLRALYLGISKKALQAKLPDIEEFCDLGNFLNMPLRTYSAGMQARLAFAVSTSIDPEVLLLDEQIGAGDGAFMQKASLRLASLVERSGILVLASHSEGAVKRFCNKGMVLDHGRMAFFGEAVEALEHYRQSQAA